LKFFWCKAFWEGSYYNYNIVFNYYSEKIMLSYLFGGRRKVQVTILFFSDIIFVAFSAANLLGTSLEFAAFGSGPDAEYSSASAFRFFLSTTMVFAVVGTHIRWENTLVLLRTINSWLRQNGNGAYLWRVWCRVRFSERKRNLVPFFMTSCNNSIFRNL